MDNLFTSTEFYIAACMAGALIFIDIWLPVRAARWLPVFMIAIACALLARYVGWV